MKEVMAVIRMNMINKTKDALSLEGFSSVTCRKVLGRGKKKIDYELIQNLISGEEIESPVIAEAVSEGHRLVPKRLLSIVGTDEDIPKIVNTIIQTNKTGSPGDGKIFVLPVTETIRIRTGEADHTAL